MREHKINQEREELSQKINFIVIKYENLTIVLHEPIVMEELNESSR